MPVTSPSDDRSPLVIAMEWTSRVTTISLEMALPALLGYWVDRQLETGAVFVALGALIGLIGGMWHLIRLTQVSTPQRQKKKPPDENFGQ